MFKAHGLSYHSTLGSRVLRKKRKEKVGVQALRVEKILFRPLICNTIRQSDFQYKSRGIKRRFGSTLGAALL